MRDEKAGQRTCILTPPSIRLVGQCPRREVACSCLLAFALVSCFVGTELVDTGGGGEVQAGELGAIN